MTTKDNTERALKIAAAVTRVFFHFEGNCAPGLKLLKYTPPSLATMRLITTTAVYEAALVVLAEQEASGAE